MSSKKNPESDISSIIAAIEALNFTEDYATCDLFKSINETEGTNNKQEFDPKAFTVALRAKAVENKKSARVFQRDIMTMAIIGTMKGSNVDSIVKKSSPDLRNFLTRMKTEYGLLSKHPKSNKDITLARIAACLVLQISKGIAKKTLDISTTVDPEHIAPKFPPCMALSTFGSLIPLADDAVSENLHDILVSAFSYHQKLFENIVNPKKDAVANLCTIAKFVTKQVNSNFYSNERRIQHCLECNILRYNEVGKAELHPCVKPAIVLAATKWNILNGKRTVVL